MIQEFNNFFENRANVKLIQKFKEKQKENVFFGIIEISTSKENLIFDVEIPSTFPFGKVDNTCITFMCKKLLGYPHINYDGSVCIHSESSSDTEQRLKNEILCLEEWIEKFYIKEEKEEHYYYLQIPHEKDCISLLFSDLPLHYFKTHIQSYGYTEFSYIQNNKFMILQSVDGQNLFWSERIKKVPKIKTIWLFLNKEPIFNKKQVPTSWEQFHKILSYSQINFIYSAYYRLEMFKKNPLGHFYLLLGYEIKSKPHWEFIKLQIKKFPIRNNYNKREKINNYTLLDVPILWQKTYNVSYERFFGRGKLSNKITESKVLIIGIGAIGSQVATILARGGIKNIEIIDFDSISPGNLCRSEYFLPHIDDFKIITLQNLLINISPYIDVKIQPYIKKTLKNHYIDVKIQPYIKKTLKNHYNYNENLKYLNDFDIIFDCSTDNELAFVLDKMGLKGKIFNLSITNKANELLCLTGKNIPEYKHYTINAINNYEKPKLIYEGEGCQYPTFEASYVDINSLVAFAIKNINTRFENNINFNNFIIRPIEKENNYSIQLFDHISFVQKEYNLFLVISTETITQIKELSSKHYPKEFGGVLLGSYLSDNHTLLITQILETSEYKNSQTMFTRESEKLNQKIKDIHQKTDGNVVYVGEWHTHPNSSPDYSQTDFLAMKSIANDNQIMTKNPILLINSFDLTKHNLCFYVYKNNNLLKYENY